jgi:hypothetical protein
VIALASHDSISAFACSIGGSYSPARPETLRGADPGAASTRIREWPGAVSSRVGIGLGPFVARSGSPGLLPKAIMTRIV